MQQMHKSVLCRQELSSVFVLKSVMIVFETLITLFNIENYAIKFLIENIISMGRGLSTE